MILHWLSTAWRSLIANPLFSLITIASLASWPLGLWLSGSWLQQYAYRTKLGLLALPLASLIVIAFAALAVGLNTARAAAIRPSFALRTAT
jgi:hypothetical protein